MFQLLFLYTQVEKLILPDKSRSLSLRLPLPPEFSKLKSSSSNETHNSLSSFLIDYLFQIIGLSKIFS